jgi:zinc/manganese transport system substrate-binding protein
MHAIYSRMLAMKAIRQIALAFAMIFAVSSTSAAGDASIGIVAAENFYGGVARQIGGDQVAVSSILNNPDQDPHLFETTPEVLRKIADAGIVVLNGANYDRWMQKLLDAVPRSGRTVISAAEIVGRRTGDNPHLWYDPDTMPAVARALAEALENSDPVHRAAYDIQLRSFLASLRPLDRKIADMRAKYAGIAVTATEPVFGYMANALGLTVRNERFQLAVMNDTEPAARDLAAFENDLRNANVSVLVHNKQVTSGLVSRLINVARRAGVPVVAITETEPANVGYVDWMMGQLDDLEQALQSSNRHSSGSRN